MKFRDLKIGQKFRFVGPAADLRGPEAPVDAIRTKASSRTFTNPDSANDRQPNGKPWKRTSRLEYAVAVVNESRRLLSFKEYLKEYFKQLIEASTDKRFWFHTKSKKLVKVTAKWHDWEVVKNAEKFGLKQSQVFEFEADVKRNVDVIGGIRRLMRIGGWRPLLIQITTGAPTWSIAAETLPEVAAAAKALSKRNEHPGRIFLDYGRKSVVLRGGQIDAFLDTGKIVVQKTEIGRTMAQFR